MHRFIDGEDRMQQALLPHSLEDYVSEENPVRVIEVFYQRTGPCGLGGFGDDAGGDGTAGLSSLDAAEDITSTATSTVSSRAGGWNGKRNAISS